MKITESKKLFKQRLQRVHVAAGITFSLFMYIAVFFGIFAILLPYISAWEKPSRHIATADITQIDYSAMIDPVLANPEYPTMNGVTITLPGYMENPTLQIWALFTETILFNPNTYEEIENEGEASQLAWFLNAMHYGRPFKDFGYLVFGFVAVGGMFLVIGGVIQIIIIKYNNKGKNAQSQFSKWHRKIFTWVFPPFIIITLTGALMNIGYTGSAPMTYLASKGETHEIWQLTSPILFPKLPPIEKKNDVVEMMPMNELIKKAKEINPSIDFQRIRISNWQDSSAQVKLEGYNPYMPFLNGISNKPSVTLSGVDGSLIAQQKVLDKHWSGIFYDSVYFLHLLFGVDHFTRLFIAFIMSISALGLGFGVLLWLEKKAKVFKGKIPFYHWMGRVSLATMIGVFPAIGLLFVLQWVLPMELEDRFLWHKGLFFVAWLATYTWSFYRIHSYQAAKEFLILGGILFMLSPLCHYIFGGWNPIMLLEGGMTTILFVDIGLAILGLLLLFVGIKLPQKAEESKWFWKTEI
jgi:uncharacterized iron-regulated membrane protein